MSAFDHPQSTALLRGNNDTDFRARYPQQSCSKALMLGGKRVRRVKILIADDNDRVRASLSRLLHSDFDVVETVTDGALLVAAAMEFRPDVIVSDICMPRLSGPRAMAELKYHGYDIPFVFVSADWPTVDLMGATFILKTDMCKDIIPAIYKAFFGQE
jgi:CheY-like chemotaxis protein